jgi:uncharacterized protein (DUF433 family)
MSNEEILKEYPQLTLADIRACVAYGPTTRGGINHELD